MQQGDVGRQRLRRALIRFLNNAANFGVDQLRSLLRDLLPVLDISPKEQFLFIRPDLNRADRVGKSPLRDVPAGKLPGFFYFAPCPRPDPIPAQNELPRPTSPPTHEQQCPRLLA